METVMRVAVIYFFLMIGFRVMGKRELGQLAPFDLVILLIIPELVAQSLTREDFSLTNGILGVSTLLSLVFLTSVISYLFKKVSPVIEGEPSIVVQHGFLVPESMARERISPDEVMAEMHKSGLEDMYQVKWGVLETDGKISFVPWDQTKAGGKSKKDKQVT